MSDEVGPPPNGSIPRGWAWSSLDALAEVVGGVTKNKKLTAGREVPYLRVANVQRGMLDLTVMKTILATEATIEDLRLVSGDILLNEGGDRDKLGRGWVWEGQIRECIHQNHVFRARLRNAAVDSKYVSFYANSVGQSYFLGEGKQTTNLASISLSKIRRLPVAVAPAMEQRRIVAEIEKQFTRLDQAVAALTAVQAKLEGAQASVLKAAVEGRLLPTEAELARREARSYEPASVLLERILGERRRRSPSDKDSEPSVAEAGGLPQLPAGWTWAQVRIVGDVKLGRQRSPEHHAGSHMRPYLRVANVFEDRLDLSDIKSMNFTPGEYEVFRLEHGDILLNEGQSPHLVGRPAMWRGEIPGACFQNTLIRFRACEGVVPAFALTVFRAQLHLRRYLRIAKITTNIAHLGAGRFADVEFPLPPTAEQVRIVEEVERRLSVLDALQHTVKLNLARCGRLRQSILKRAFEGKLVPQDPADETASQLLARIRAQRAEATA